MSSWIGGNRYLTVNEMINNAKKVVDYLTSLGWSSEAILGTIVNMVKESNINPQIWENLTYDPVHNGYGLVQWTPAGEKIIPWCEDRRLDYTDGDNQLLRINWESQNNVQWFYNRELPDSRVPGLPRDPPVTFAQYTQMNDAVWAARYWLVYYEHPLFEHVITRYNSAPSDVQTWRERLEGYIPGPAGDIPKLPITMYLRRRFF